MCKINKPHLKITVGRNAPFHVLDSEASGVVGTPK